MKKGITNLWALKKIHKKYYQQPNKGTLSISIIAGVKCNTDPYSHQNTVWPAQSVFTLGGEKKLF